MVYVAGPGDVIESFRCWREGVDDPSQVAVTYSGQFYQACRELDLEGYVISSHPRAERLDAPPFRFEHRPMKGEGTGGIRYHLGEIAHILGLVASCVRFRADLVLLQGGYRYWSLFATLRLAGIKVIPVLMVVLWHKHVLAEGRRRSRAGFNDWFFRRVPWKILSMSDDISRQVVELTAGRSAPIERFLPQFRRASFPAEPPPARPPFRVLFAGRIEGYKGVFHLLEVAIRLASQGRTDVEFDLCGTGGALEGLKRQVESSGVAGRFRLHGHCNQTDLGRMYRGAHAVVVPTTTEFVEGFNQVVIESVLSIRPVVTSSVCPSLEYVREAAVEVPPDDVAAYASAILRLADDASYYAAKRDACHSLREGFLGTDRTFGAVLARVLAVALPPEGCGGGRPTAPTLVRPASEDR